MTAWPAARLQNYAAITRSCGAVGARLVVICITLVAVGCGQSGQKGAEIAAEALRNAASESTAHVGSDTATHLRVIPTSVGIRQSDSVARPIPYLRLFAVQKSLAAQHMAQGLSLLEREVAEIETQLKKNQADLAAASDALQAAQGEISRKYNERVPDSSELPTKRDRDPLGKLLAAGAKKSAADREYQADHRDTIEPLSSRVTELKKLQDSHRAAINDLLESRLVKMFEALPETDAQVFTTDEAGRVNIALPSASAWVVWAQSSRVVTPTLTEHYRWVVRVPEDLDADGSLVLSNHTLLSEKASALWSDIP